MGLIAAVLLVLWAAGRLQLRNVTIHWSLLHIPAGLFLLLGILQFAGHLTLTPFGTREALIELASALIFFFLAGQLWAEASEKTWESLGLAVAAYAISLSLFAIVQFFSSQGLLYWVIHSKGNVFGPYVNHNDYAGLMEMLIPLGFCYALSRSPKSNKRMLLIFGVCGAMASVFLSGSRGGAISLVVEMALLGLLLWKWKAIRIPRERGVRGLVVAAAVGALFLVILPWGAWQHLATVEGLASTPDVTLGNRLAVSRDALQSLRDYPWLGTGLGSFETIFPQYQTFSTELVWHHAHDDYVEALTETGVVGGLIMLSALLLFGFLAFRNFPERLKHRLGWVQLGAAIGCCGLLVHSFSDFNLHIPANAAWFAVCVGLSTIPGSSRQTGEMPAGGPQ